MEYRFYAVDWYEGREILCRSDILYECYYAVLQRMEDTDGECSCEIEDTYMGGSIEVSILRNCYENDEENDEEEE